MHGPPDDASGEEPEPELLSWRAPPLEGAAEQPAALAPAPPAPAPAPAPPAPPTAEARPTPAPAPTPPPPIPPPPGAPPKAPTPEAPVAAVPAVHQWRSLRGLRTALTILFGAIIAALVLFGAALAIRYVVADRIDSSGLTPSRAIDLRDADDLVEVTSLIVWSSTFVIAVVFIAWLWRAAKNNQALGRAHPRFAPGWAIGAWFVPFAMVVLPVMVVQELWRGSTAGIPRDDPAWRRARGSALVGAWWAFYLASLVLSAVQEDTTRTTAARDEFEFADRILSHDPFAMGGALAGVVAAILAIRVVRTLTRRQEETLVAQRTAWERDQRATT